MTNCDKPVKIQKLIIGTDVISYLTHCTLIPTDSPKKTSMQRLARKIEIAQGGLDKGVLLAVMGEFRRVDNNALLCVDSFSYAEIFQGSLEILDENNGCYIKVMPTLKAHYKLYI